MRLAPLLAVPLLALAAAANAGELATPHDLAGAFVRALTTDEVGGYAAITTPVELARMRSVTEVIERMQCVFVRSWRVTAVRTDTPVCPDGQECPSYIHLEIDGGGLTRGKSQRAVRLPHAWVLEIECGGNGWRLKLAETAERRAARLLLADPPIDWAAALAERADLDPLAFARELAWDSLEIEFPAAAGPRFAFALSLARDAGDRSTEAYCLSNRSVAEFYQHREDDAVATARAALEVAEAAGDSDEIARAHFQIGIALWIAGRAKVDDALAAEACRELDTAGELADVIDDPRIALKGFYMSAYVHRLRGNVRDFVLRNERVIDLSRRFGWLEGAAVARVSLAELAITTRNYPVAVDDFQHAFDEALRAGALHIAASALYGVGLAQMKNGDMAAAATTLGRAERDFRTDTSGGAAGVTIGFEMGFFFLENGRFAEAEARFTGARDNARKIYYWSLASGASTALSLLRLRQGRPHEALALAREALDDHSRVAVDTLEWSPWKARLAEAKALRALGDSTGAASSLRESIAALEVQREEATVSAVASALFFEDKVEPYRELIDLLMESGRVAEAFSYAERMKARALQDALEQGSVDRDSVLSAAEKEEDRALTQRLSELNRKALATESADLQREIAEARVALDRFQERVELKHPQARMARAHLLQTTALPQSLGDGIVIEFVVDEKRTHVFAVSRSRIIGRTIAVGRRDLESRVSRLERQVAQRDFDWSRTARDLYDLLLAPIDDALGSRRLVCIVPDGVLWRLPFHLLMDQTAIFYAPSLAMLHATERRGSRHASTPTLVAFGNPTVIHAARERVRAMTRDVALQDLPDAESEVRAIASIYGPRRSRVYVRDAARESIFKSQVSRFGVVHLAAHGVFDDHWPMYSAIVLTAAPGEDDDGLLEAREILGLDVGADLAVLASCDTGRGRVRPGEGMIGMSWAFLVAGCPTTVVSQWIADSKATEMLMIEFHRQLRAGRNAALALRRAQQHLRRDPRYADPFYWAPFIVVGAGMRAPAH